jgi:hypothetical protein
MPAGRPPAFTSPDDLQDLIDGYFESGVRKKKVVVGKPPNTQVIEIEVPTITGLCIYLGFESRQSFYDYEDKEEFAYTIKRARLFIENEYEELLQTGNTTGAIFALKNFGWRDKQEIDQKTEHSGSITHTIDHSKLSDAALREIASLDRPEESKD